MQRSPASLAPVAPRTLAGVNVAAYVIFVVLVPAIAPLLGPDNASMSRKYTTPITPAGYAFAIWSLIWALQGGGVLLSALPNAADSPWKRAAVGTISFGWAATWLFQAAWLVVFPLDSRPSMVASALLLFAALAAMATTLARLQRLLAAAGPAAPFAGSGAGSEAQPSLLVWSLFWLPSALNAAWLSVASCLGVAVLADALGTPASQQLALGAGLASLVSGLGLFLVLARRDVAYGLTVVWALAAVARKHSWQAEPLIHGLCLGATALLVLASAWVLWRHLQQERRRSPSSGSSGPREALLGASGAAAQ